MLFVFGSGALAITLAGWGIGHWPVEQIGNATLGFTTLGVIAGALCAPVALQAISQAARGRFLEAQGGLAK